MTLGIFFREYILVFGARGKKEYSNLKEEKNVFIAKQANKKQVFLFYLRLGATGKVFKVWSLDYQHQYHLRTGYKQAKVLGSNPDLLNQTLLGSGLIIFNLTCSTNDCDTQSN